MDRQLFGTFCHPTFTAELPPYVQIPLVARPPEPCVPFPPKLYWVCCYCGREWRQKDRPRTCYGYCGGSDFVRHIDGNDEVLPSILHLDAEHTFSDVYDKITDAATESTRECWRTIWETVGLIVAGVGSAAFVIFMIWLGAMSVH